NETWYITGPNAGNVDGVTFTGFQNLTGGSGNDTFVFSNGQSVTGTIDGGGGTNTLVGPNANEVWYITGTNYGNVGRVTFTNVHGLTGGSGNDAFVFTYVQGVIGTINGGGRSIPDALPNANETWYITGPNAGTVGGVSFANVQNLTGGSGNDTF